VVLAGRGGGWLDVHWPGHDLLAARHERMARARPARHRGPGRRRLAAARVVRAVVGGDPRTGTTGWMGSAPWPGWVGGQGLDARPQTIAWHLAHHHIRVLSPATISRCLARAGLVVPEPSKRPKSSYKKPRTLMWVRGHSYVLRHHSGGRSRIRTGKAKPTVLQPVGSRPST
jgi:hypothetical protein